MDEEKKKKLNGGAWSYPSRPRNTDAPIDKKKRWLYLCKNAQVER